MPELGPRQPNAASSGPAPTRLEPGRRRAIVLYGPPASGKDTVTAALTDLDPRYQHFHPLKAGPGRSTGYRMTTPGELKQLRGHGALIWETHRYEATYAIDASELQAMLDAGQIPVLHLAEPAAPAALAATLPDIDWFTVVLTCPRDVAEHRIRARATRDTEARLAAYDAFREPDRVNQRISTATLTPGQAAAAIADAESTTTAQPR